MDGMVLSELTHSRHDAMWIGSTSKAIGMNISKEQTPKPPQSPHALRTRSPWGFVMVCYEPFHARMCQSSYTPTLSARPMHTLA